MEIALGRIADYASLVSGLTPEVLEALLSGLEVRHVPKGEILFEKGDAADCAYLISSGTVRIIKQHGGAAVALARRGTGELFGEMALIDTSPRFASAVGETDCVLWVLPRERFFHVLSRYPQMVVSILRALTARTREADEIRLLEIEAALEYRERILSVSPYPIVVTNTSGEVEIANAAAESLFGPRSQPLLWEWVSACDPEVQAELQSVSAMGISWRKEIKTSRPLDKVILCRVVMAPVPDPDGRRAGRLWMFEDLTEVRALEQQALIQGELAIKGEMAAEIAHEMNNYLAILSGNLELLPLKMRSNCPPEVQPILKKIHHALERIVVFTDGLLRSRHPCGERSRTDLNEFLKTQILFLHTQKRFRTIVIETAWDDSVPPIDCDRSGLQQVFYNLLLNAVDALGDAAAGHHTVFVSTHFDGPNENAILTVADDGPGISPEVASLLFRERTSSKPTGHGFGTLTIARIIGEHGGTIAAGPRKGGGAEFTISLPVCTTGSIPKSESWT